MFLEGRKTSYGLTLKRLADPKPIQRQLSFTLSQQFHILPFLELFLPTTWTKSKISQHVLTKILDSVTHTLKSLNLKYYHHATPRSVNFLFSKSLSPKAPL